jgi:hypothetical protein
MNFGTAAEVAARAGRAGRWFARVDRRGRPRKVGYLRIPSDWITVR